MEETIDEEERTMAEQRKVVISGIHSVLLPPVIWVKGVQNYSFCY